MTTAGSSKELNLSELAALERKWAEQRKDSEARDIAERDFIGYLMLAGSHERTRSLLDLLARDDVELTDAEYWQCVAFTWTGCDSIARDLSTWLDLFGSSRSSRLHLMESDEDRVQFDALPETMTVYRGYSHPDARDGLAWTLDQKKAEWFAHWAHRSGRTQHHGAPAPTGRWIATATVTKDQVVAYFGERSESEVVILNALDARVRELEPDGSDQQNKVTQCV